jgi:hypothetical protein
MPTFLPIIIVIAKEEINTITIRDTIIIRPMTNGFFFTFYSSFPEPFWFRAFLPDRQTGYSSQFSHL